MLRLMRCETGHASLCLLLIIMKQGYCLTEVNYNKISHFGNTNGDRICLIEVTIE